MTNRDIGPSPALRAIQLFGLMVVAGLFVLDRSATGVRVLGGLVMFQAIVFMFTSNIPYGREGKEPSGHITGWMARAIALALLTLGAVIAAKPKLFLEVFG